MSSIFFCYGKHSKKRVSCEFLASTLPHAFSSCIPPAAAQHSTAYGAGLVAAVLLAAVASVPAFFTRVSACRTLQKTLGKKGESADDDNITLKCLADTVDAAHHRNPST